MSDVCTMFAPAAARPGRRRCWELRSISVCGDVGVLGVRELLGRRLLELAPGGVGRGVEPVRGARRCGARDLEQLVEVRVEALQVGRCAARAVVAGVQVWRDVAQRVEQLAVAAGAGRRRGTPAPTVLI